MTTTNHAHDAHPESTDTTTTGQTTTASSDGDVILEVQDVSVSFDMERGTAGVLKDVNLDIYRNEIIGVIGESGSGKSMFAESLLDAVVEPGHLTGDIVYYPEDGEPVNVLELSTRELKHLRWETISMVFQGAMDSFNPTKRIRGHFTETLKAHGADIDRGMAHAEELLADLYLDPDRVLDAYPHELSGGMTQRALIALSLLLKPDVLVMDEPTAALDLLMQRSILSLLHRLKEKYELTIVFITHDLPLVAALADRLAVMYAFEFIEVGPTQTIIESAAHPYTRSLLNSTPNIETPVEEMRSIGGSSPDPVDIPSGCSYHPRCPIADEQCTRDDPPFEPVHDGQRTACFNWQQAADAIAFTTEDDQ